MSKTIKITLAASVLLNVLLIGILIGSFSHMLAGPFQMQKHMKEVIGKLPEDKQELVRGTMKELRSETKVTKKKVDAKREEIMEVLTAPEFDAALFDRKVAELHDLMGELASEVAEAAKKIASNLDQQDRIMLSELIKRKPGPPHPRHGGWDNWDDGTDKGADTSKGDEINESGAQ